MSLFCAGSQAGGDEPEERAEYDAEYEDSELELRLAEMGYDCRVARAIGRPLEIRLVDSA